jgi:Spy/CpxP family protein refolding chaperone
MKKLAVFFAGLMVTAGMQLLAQPQLREAEFNRFEGKLKLTADQKKDFDKIRTEMDKQLITQRAKVQTAGVDLEQLLKADNPDKSAIEKKLNSISELTAQLRMIRIDAWFDINKILTPEQQKIWKKALSIGPAMGQGMMHEKGMMHRNNGGKGMGRGMMNSPEPPPQPSPNTPSPQ